MGFSRDGLGCLVVVCIFVYVCAVVMAWGR